MEAWVARDADGSLRVFPGKPSYDKKSGDFHIDGTIFGYWLTESEEKEAGFQSISTEEARLLENKEKTMLPIEARHYRR